MRFGVFLGVASQDESLDPTAKKWLFLARFCVGLHDDCARVVALQCRPPPLLNFAKSDEILANLGHFGGIPHIPLAESLGHAVRAEQSRLKAMLAIFRSILTALPHARSGAFGAFAHLAAPLSRLFSAPGLGVRLE